LDGNLASWPSLADEPELPGLACQLNGATLANWLYRGSAMSLERRVLLVSQTPSWSDAVAPTLRRTGFRLMVALTYHSAKQQLAQAPQVLVTELKLGEYNGLHLALRSLAAGVRTIVVADKAFEAEVEQLGATWMSPEGAASGELVAAIQRLLASPDPTTASWYDAQPERPTTALVRITDYAIVH
jgi:DNA-binding response OmpR family regulator